MSLNLPAGVQINAPLHPRFDEIFTHDALALVAKLHRAFEGRRQELLKARVVRQARIDAGDLPDFLPETKAIREGDWKIAPLPKALERRRTEITGPVEAKMIINAYNSGADSYMTDFEDSNSPNWYNQIQGQVNLFDAIRRNLSFVNEVGKEYRLNDQIATGSQNVGGSSSGVPLDGGIIELLIAGAAVAGLTKAMGKLSEKP